MRLLLLTQYFPPEIGAAQSRLDAMTRAIKRAGHDIDVVTAMPSYPTDRIMEGYRGRWFLREDMDGRDVTRTWAFPAMGSGMRRMASYAAFSATGMLGLLRSRKPDVLIIESPPLTLALPAMIWARVRRIPRVFNVADLWPDAAVAVGALHDGPLLSAMYRLERWTYRHADLVSTVTDGVAGRLLNEKHLDPTKLVMLPNGVDTEQFVQVAGTGEGRRLLDLPDGPFVIYAGTMGLVHGVEPLIDAFAILSNDAKPAPYLVMLGAGSERSKLEDRARAAKASNIHFRDPIPPDRLAVLLHDALAGVVTLADLPINELSRPAKLFPIMASGLPVLFAGAGEGARCVSESGGGLVVTNQPQDIARAVRSLASDPDAATAMGAAARVYVEKNLSWQQLIDVWLTRVQQLLHRN